jgi:TPR repeat protein
VRLIPTFLLVGMLAVCGWAEYYKPEPYSAELVKKAEEGDAEAQYNLGQCYENGQVGIKDNKEAVKWYIKSAEQGYAKTAFALSRCYEDGKGVPRDKNEARKWFIKGVESNDESELLRILDSIYYEGGEGGEEKKTLLCRRLAELGNVKAQRELGGRDNLNYVDRKESMEWLTKAAEQGDAEAQFMLGQRYQRGSGEAVKWFTKAAEQGNENAKKELEELKSK